MDSDKAVVRDSSAAYKLLAVLIVTLLVYAAGLASPAIGSTMGVGKPRKPRSHTVEYLGGMPNLGLRADLWIFCGTRLPLGGIYPVCATLDAKPSEKWITVVIEDASGLDIGAWVMRDKDGNGNDGINRNESTWICGATRKPIKIKSEYDGPVRVVVHTSDCARSLNEDAHPATKGTITVTFYKKRPPCRHAVRQFCVSAG